MKDFWKGGGKLRVLVTGSQGSGKSTQAVLLAQDLGVPYIQVGEILRNISLVEDSKTAKMIKDTLSKGELLPAQLIVQIMNNRLSQPDCQKGFVLDGYPRNVQDVKNFNQNLDRVVNLKISATESVKRLLERGRADDTRKLIRERLANYHAETEPILQIFKNKGILVEIDGEREIDDIHQDIIKLLAADEVH